MLIIEYELIDEKLKVFFAKRYRLEASDAEVDSSYSEMARRMRQSADGMSKLLTAQGIDEDSRSPVDVDAVLLEQSQMRAITGGDRWNTGFLP